jgi:hypothetical protein
MLRCVDWKLVIDVLGQPIGPILKDQAVLFGLLDPWKMEPLDCPETSLNNYQSTHRNSPEE